MFEIYCAFNSAVNKTALELGQGHVVKIGHTDPRSKTPRIKVLQEGWPPGAPEGKKRSLPLAADKSWDYVGRWPVQYDRSDTKKLEVRIQEWFRRRCGETALIERMRSVVSARHVEMNGLTELVCIDLAKIGEKPYIAPAASWTYRETLDLIRRIIEVVRKNDIAWRDCRVCEVN